MRLKRIGSFHPTRISFARTLIRRMAGEGWRISTEVLDLDGDGFGRIVYRVDTPKGPLTFSGFANPLDPSERTDRVIAEKWDAAFVLSIGAPEAIDIDRLAREAPLQEMGRCGDTDFVLSRANKSVRLFESVVAALSEGRQPDVTEIANVGYLMRTTAVYGNGKFGMADFLKAGREGHFTLPFQAEMLCVYLIREFTLDLVDHVARARGGDRAVPMARNLRRCFGIGNATGLGMAPYLVNHPKLLHNWITARETAIARVRAVEHASDAVIATLKGLLDRVLEHLRQWPTADAGQQAEIARLNRELTTVRAQFFSNEAWLSEPYPWNRLAQWAESEAGLETQEMLNSLTLEPYGPLIDELENTTASDESETTEPGMSVGSLRGLIEEAYGWALTYDFSDQAAERLFWYRSAEKEEPRLGKRHDEPGAELELPIGIARDVTRLHHVLADTNPDASVTEFLIEHPEFRRIARRVQSLAHLPYAEFRDNLLDAGCEPIDILRCKLSIFGAVKFDPKSMLWTRIALFQGAPLPDELTLPEADDWFAPVLRGAEP